MLPIPKFLSKIVSGYYRFAPRLNVGNDHAKHFGQAAATKIKRITGESAGFDWLSSNNRQRSRICINHIGAYSPFFARYRILEAVGGSDCGKTLRNLSVLDDSVVNLGAKIPRRCAAEHAEVPQRVEVRLLLRCVLRFVVGLLSPR